MSVNYTLRNTKITPKIKKYCERRAGFLEKYLGYNVDINIVLSVEKYRHKAEINAKVKGNTLNAEEETEDILSSLVLAFDSIEKRVKKGKEKTREKKRRKAKEREAFPSQLGPVDTEKRIIVSHDYSLKPMSLEEAILQLDYKNRELFVFRKIETEKWAVVFKRNDGNYGLIEPE